MVNFKSLIGDQAVVANNKNIKVNTPVFTIKVPSNTATKQYFTMYLNKQCAEWLELLAETQKIAFLRDDEGNFFIANKKAFELLKINDSLHPTINKSLSINDKKIAGEILSKIRSSRLYDNIGSEEQDKTLEVFAQYFVREDIHFKCLILNFDKKVSDINEGIANGSLSEDAFTYTEEVEKIMDSQLVINFEESNQ